MMASSDEQIYEECMIDDQTEEEEEEEEEDSDDSDEDLTFDIIDDTRSKLSSLSIKKTPKSRLGKERIDDEEENGEKDSYQIVEGIIRAGQLEKLKVEQCKVYLRKHGLRLTGNKDTLIQRIREHLDVTGGGGEHKYPVSSFVVNCKGDACTGDVVLFEQNVYEMYSRASRSATGPPRGTRLVAGRIVKESYGAEKQQHTFTIEVLWSTGEKPLPPLHPLLIKGRNLYRLKTMRQKWEDEGERQKMLSEKHARGHVARSNRETRVREKEMRKNMRQGKMEEQKRPTSANIAMNTMKEQRPQKPPNLESHIGNVRMERHQHQFQHPGSQHNLESHISNGQMERRHHQHMHPKNQHNLQSHTGNVLMERHHHQYQQPGRQPLKEITHSLNPLNSVQRPMIMEDKKKPTPVNIAMNAMALKPPENKPSNLETHIGNVLLERHRRHYQHPVTPQENKLSNLETHIGNVLLERQRHQYQHQHPLTPPENKPGNLETHIGNALLEKHRHQYQHPGSQNNPGNVLLERHHHQYQHPGSQPLASTNYNFPRDHLPGKAVYEGQNMSNNSLNSVQRASHYGSYASHNSIRSPSRAPTRSISGKHGANIDAHFMRENPVHGHFQEKKQQACRYFAQGRCHFGDRCKLLHEDPRIQKQH